MSTDVQTIKKLYSLLPPRITIQPSNHRSHCYYLHTRWTSEIKMIIKLYSVINLSTSLTNNESNRKLLNNPQIEPQKNSEFKQQAKWSKRYKNRFFTEGTFCAAQAKMLETSTQQHKYQWTHLQLQPSTLLGQSSLRNATSVSNQTLPISCLSTGTCFVYS